MPAYVAGYALRMEQHAAMTEAEELFTVLEDASLTAPDGSVREVKAGEQIPLSEAVALGLVPGEEAEEEAVEEEAEEEKADG